MWVKGGHAGDGVFKGAANCCHEVIVGEGGLDYAAAYVARCAKYLGSLCETRKTVIIGNEGISYDPYSLLWGILRARWIAAYG